MVTSRTKKMSMNRCAYLRWKGMFIQVEVDPEFDQSNDTAMWCHHTYKCVGPDGKIVDDFECNPSRGCYEQL